MTELEERVKKVMKLVDSIESQAETIGLDRHDTFKACMSYAVELARVSIDKAEFMKLAEEGWDLRMANLKK